MRSIAFRTFEGVLGLALMAMAAGCGGSDPLGLEHRRDGAASGTDAAVSKTTDEANAAPRAPILVAPSLVDLNYSETSPGELPADLKQVIEKAADHLSRDERLSALQSLVDPQSLENQKLTADDAAARMPRINAILMHGTLRKMLASPVRLSQDGAFALIEVSDSTHARFNRIRDQWRLSDRLAPDADRPGLSYDNVEEHARFLLKKLGDVDAANESAEPWKDSEKKFVELIREAGAGLARGRDANGRTATAVVFNRSFQGTEEWAGRLKDLEGVRIVAIYEAPFSDASLAELAKLPELHSLRLLRDTIFPETLATLSTISSLRRLNATSIQRSFCDVRPLGKLTRLERLDLINLAFEASDLNAWSPLTQLRDLDLSRSAVDDAILKKVGGFSQLQTVRLSTDAVSVEGIQEFRAAVPNLFIDW